ncbi:MAG: hypothetical protein ACK5GE_01380, partial [Rhodoluna sp.]
MQDFEDWEADTDQVRTEPPGGRLTLTAILYYPDILDLRLAGYELERFESLLFALDSASYRKALRVSSMLNRSDAS